MGHIISKDIYRDLGKAIDQSPTRAPWNQAFHALLKELYTEEEADFIVRMPKGLATREKISRATGREGKSIELILSRLCGKGLVMDLFLNGEYFYIPSPFVIGIFEFTMMRTGKGLNSGRWAELFNEYMHGSDAFAAANCGDGNKVAIMRSLPHEEAIPETDHIQILDYEKAAELVDESDRFSIGYCSCRHEKHHLGIKNCEIPLESCTSFGFAADYLIRNGLAREISRSAMHDCLARSKELGLVLNADNVQKRISFMCHCCKCCCNALAGLSKFGYENAIVTSSFIAETDSHKCTGCGKCAKACPIGAVSMLPLEEPKGRKKKEPVVDKKFCLGCGVCGLKCEAKAMILTKRGKRVIVPETTFEKSVLAALERGTLQHMIFENRKSVSQKFMRGMMGAFLKATPVRKALMSDALRSTFLEAMKTGVRLQGKGWILDL